MMKNGKSKQVLLNEILLPHKNISLSYNIVTLIFQTLLRNIFLTHSGNKIQLGKVAVMHIVHFDLIYIILFIFHICIKGLTDVFLSFCLSKFMRN